MLVRDIHNQIRTWTHMPLYLYQNRIVFCMCEYYLGYHLIVDIRYCIVLYNKYHNVFYARKWVLVQYTLLELYREICKSTHMYTIADYSW